MWNTLLTVLDVFRAIGVYFILFPFAVCLIMFKRIPHQFRYIIYFVFIATAGEAVAEVLIRLRIHSLPALHAYTLIEGIILLLLYCELLSKKIKPILFKLVIIAFSLFSILNAIFIQGIYEINSNARTVEAILIMGCAILFYFVLFESKDVYHPAKAPLILINNGIFLYFSMSVLYFIFGNYLMHNYSVKVNEIVWSLHTLFLIIFHLILARGIWLLGKKAAS